MWWNDGWRYRTVVTRPTPWRDEGARPVEAVVDFARLLEKAGITGEFDPDSLRVIAPTAEGAGTEVPFACRTESDYTTGRDRTYLAWMAQPGEGSGIFHIYFDTKDRGIAPPSYPTDALPPENLLANPNFDETADGFPTHWSISPPELMQFGRFAHTTGNQSLKIIIDENTPATLPRQVTIEQRVDVRQFAGKEMVFECDLLAERATYGAPVTIELQQFREDGSRIFEYAVDPRWLTIELAQGQFVQFRERGRFHAEAATVNVQIRFRCTVKDADTGEIVDGPDTFFTVWLDRLVLRPGERWPWPAEARGGFVEGALENAPLNRAFEFTGRRRLAFNGDSEGALSRGELDTDPRSLHWGVQTGTLEFWCRPSWGPGDARERVFFEGIAYARRSQSYLSKVRVRGKNCLKFTIQNDHATDYQIITPAPFQAGRWHHVAVTWNLPEAHLQLFFDGKLMGVAGPGLKPVPIAAFRHRRHRHMPQHAPRQLPIQAYIGGNENCGTDDSVEAAIDEFRVSDIARYTTDFTPARREFACDEHTRALFHFENERDGIHIGDDGFVRGHLACELPRQEETVALEIRTGTRVESRAVVVQPHATQEQFEANRAENRMIVKRPFLALPDPRFTEHCAREAERTVRDGQETFTLDVGGDFEPLMRSVTFRHAEEGPTTLLPRWRANDNVVPFSVKDLAETLGANVADDAQKAFEVFKYALATSNYFSVQFCETLPTRHRPRIAWTLLKALNIYPLHQCGPMNHMLRKIFLAVGISSNNALGTHHQFGQAFYLGQWRLYDLAPRLFWLQRDNASVASRRDIEEDPYLLIRQINMFNAWIRGYAYDQMLGQAERPHSMDFPLRSGEEASVCWHNEGRWFELVDEREPETLAKLPPYFGNGALVYTPSAEGDAAALENLSVEEADGAIILKPRDPSKPASLTYHVHCPYILSDGTVTGEFTARKAGGVSLSVSFDGGKQWNSVWRSRRKSGTINASLLDQITARYEYWLRLDLPAGGATIRNFRVRSTFVVSTLSLPGKLSRGPNRIAFRGGPVTSPVTTTCRWIERRKVDLGVSLNTLSYYLNGDETHRNLLICSPDRPAALAVTLQGRAFQGEVALEGLPATWIEGAQAQPVSLQNADPAVVKFQIRPIETALATIQAFNVVLRERGKERRIEAQALIAESPLVREAEAADEITGSVAAQELPEASGARVMTFSGEGALHFKFETTRKGRYALWLRARWDKKEDAEFTLKLDGHKPRRLPATAMFGFTNWTSARAAYTKMYSSFGEQYGHWSWYRISSIALAAGEHRMVLGAQEGASFDALALLPQNDTMDRAAMNLFQNWNYSPWRNPL